MAVPKQLTNTILIEKYSGFPADVAAKLEKDISKASKKLRALIGDTAYDDLSSRPAEDPDRERAAQAESLLAVYYGLPKLNLRVTKIGGIVKATGIDQTRNEIMSKNEMEKYRADFLGQALFLIDDLIEEDLDEDGNVDGYTGPFSMDAL